MVHEINDISFVGVEHPELGPGYDLWVGGGLSTNPRLAVRLGAFVAEEDVPDVWAGVVSVFRDYGYRRMRHKARLKFLLADWGPEKFREVLETEYLKRPAARRPGARAAPTTAATTSASTSRRTAATSSAPPPSWAGSPADQLIRLADTAEAHGSSRVRLTPHQKLLVLDVEPERTEPLVQALRDLGLEAEPSVFRRHTHGLHRHRVLQARDRRDQGHRDPHRRPARGAAGRRHRPDSTSRSSIHVNGCPNSCARIQVADIGLKGQIVTDDDGNQVEGFQVHLGGTLGLDAGFGRKVRGLKTTSEQVPVYVERVVRNFVTRP